MSGYAVGSLIGLSLGSIGLAALAWWWIRK